MKVAKGKSEQNQHHSESTAGRMQDYLPEEVML